MRPGVAAAALRSPPKRETAITNTETGDGSDPVSCFYLPLRIVQASSDEEIQQARQLFEEYAAGLGFSLCFQNFDGELAELPGKYAPPSGRLFLATDDEDRVAGCIALRSIGPGVCEMKRLFVRGAYRGQGLGRVLVDKLIDEARAIGYTHMRLDTLPGVMDNAIALYRSIGFVEIGPYCENPVEGAKFMELDLEPQIITEESKRTKGTEQHAKDPR
jgi:putative acetyltransferase